MTSRLERIRPMEWDGAVNARRIAGDIFGMGRSEWLTETGWRQMYDDGVRTVVDLRNVGERSRRKTDPEVAAEVRSPFTVLNCPTEEPDHAEFRELSGPYLSHPRSYPDNLRLFPDKITAIARTLAGAEGAVVIHCSAGRDRTGLIAMMLLNLVGADSGTIADHYEFGLRGINEWHRISPYPHPIERYLSGPELAARIEDTRAAVEAAAEGFDAAQYLLRNGLGEAELRQLRNRLHLD